TRGRGRAPTTVPRASCPPASAATRRRADRPPRGRRSRCFGTILRVLCRTRPRPARRAGREPEEGGAACPLPPPGTWRRRAPTGPPARSGSLVGSRDLRLRSHLQGPREGAPGEVSGPPGERSARVDAVEQRTRRTLACLGAKCSCRCRIHVLEDRHRRVARALGPSPDPRHVQECAFDLGPGEAPPPELAPQPAGVDSAKG